MTRFDRGLVLGKFLPLHAGHAHLIETAKQRCDVVVVQLLASVREPIPMEVRREWIALQHPDIELVTGYDEVPVDFDDPLVWDRHMEIIKVLLPAPVDAVFTSDEYGAELARRLDATWVQVDPGRVQTPVSGTAVRADPARNWWALSGPVRDWYATRFVVVGAESTGTTTLSRALAVSLDAPWVEEYGRRYTEECRPDGLDSPWASEEFLTIARRQIELEQDAAACSRTPLIVCDTDVLATAIWHERYLGTASADLHELAARRPPAGYVLTGDEIPFVQDGWRDGEHVRRWMSARFREVLRAQDTPWIEVTGSPNDRLAASLEFVNEVMDGSLRRVTPAATLGGSLSVDG